MERSRFSLAQDKAIEKMRKYALPDPRLYILELVRGAVFAGARAIALDTTGSRVTLAWLGGRAYQAEELERLFDYLLIRQGSDETRHITQLAIAINALLLRSPKQIHIESGDGSSTGTVRVELNAEGDAVLGIPEEGIEGTFISFAPPRSWMPSFLEERDPRDEVSLIEAWCQHCTVPIVLNGSAPFGWEGGRPFTPGESFDHGDRWGSIHTESGGPLYFDIVIGGVVAQRRNLPELGALMHGTRLLGGVICDDNLRRTADYSKIVEDRAFHQMLHALQPQCTKLLRREDKLYRPPTLVPIPSAPSEGDSRSTIRRPAAETLPEKIPQLGDRPEVEIDTLRAAGADRPAFWVRPMDADGLVDSASFDRLPYPVLVLSGGQHRTLQAKAPQLSLWALSKPADVDFYLRSMDRQAIRPAIEVDVAAGRLRGSLRIRATLRGPTPGWALDAGADQVPLVIVHRGATVLASAVRGLPIPRLDMLLTLDSAAPAPRDDALDSEMLAALGQQARAELHRLLQALCQPQASPSVERARRDILASALGVLAQPHFVREDGVTGLMAHIPGASPAQVKALRSTVLIDTTDGPLSFDGFVALQGTPRAVTVRSQADLDRMATLEARFGHGHLMHSSVNRRVLTAAAIRADQEDQPPIWLCYPMDAPVPEALAVVWVGENLGVQPPPNMQPANLGLTGVGAARARQGALLDLTPGLQLLFEALLSSVRSPAGDSEQDDRTRGMVRTALASLVDTRPEWRNTPVFDVGSAAWSLGRVRDHRDFGIVPRGGITSAEKTVLALSLDEVRAIERDDACHLPLRFDDPPTVWTEPELTDWLVRTPIHFGSTRGWVGLRFPFDGTGAIMSRIEGRLIPEGPASRRLPSHGIIWSARPQVGDQPTPPHIIQLAQRQLYTLLAEGLGQGRWSGERAETADCYARIWVLHEVGTDRRPSTTLGTALAESASVPGTDGSRWGSLATWLKTPASERPAMDHQPIERTAAPSSLPSMDQPLAAWLTQLAQWVTGEPLLEVALRPNPLFDEVSDPVLQAGPSGTDWRTCWVTISDDLRMSVNDPRIGLETRWMIALFMLRRWLPNLRKNWVDVDLATCRQDMLSRLLVSQST